MCPALLQELGILEVTTLGDDYQAAPQKAK